MILNKPITTLAGGLILVLASISCSSKADTRTTANPRSQDNVIASDRTASTHRTGPDDNRVTADRMVACADQKGDMTGSADCALSSRREGSARTGRDRTAYDSSTEAMAACASRTDAKGNVIYEDPTCPTRYRQPRQQMGSSYENVTWSQESAFFDRYIGNAVKHARAAEIAGNLGHAPEMRQHAQLSLEQANEAQRAGNVPGLNEGINSLREALNAPMTANRTGTDDNRSASDRMAPCADQKGDTTGSVDCEAQNRRMGDDRTGSDRTAYDSPAGAMAACASRTDVKGNVIYDDPACPARFRQPQSASLQDATALVRDARIRLSQAGGMRPTDTRPIGALVVNTNSTAGTRARTVKGELIGDEASSASSRLDGGHHYILRDRNGKDITILLPQDMGRNVRAGDKVEAQVDSAGRVLTISKDQ